MGLLLFFLVAALDVFVAAAAGAAVFVAVDMLAVVFFVLFCPQVIRP